MSRYAGNASAGEVDLYTEEETFFGPEKSKVPYSGKEFGAIFQKRLREIFPQCSDPILMTNSKNAPLYCLLFAGHNRTGRKIAGEIFGKLRAKKKMSDKSAIEWTDATWNPVTGCTKVSPGCAHCYAETFAERFRGVPGHSFEQGFDMKLWPERLTLPLRWTEPRRIFVNSMSDLFHEAIPDDFVDKIFEVMTEADQHVFQVLTKRAERMAAWTRSKFSTGSEPKNGTNSWPAHVWLGVSVENQRFTSRIRYLRQTPALIRFLSVEPLLGPMNLEGSMLEDIHWVIVGGESGPRARPVKPEWVSKIREQCQKHRVPFFFKQWGAYDPSGKRVGKKAAGRILDGRTWDELPVVPHLKEERSDRRT